MLKNVCRVVSLVWAVYAVIIGVSTGCWMLVTIGAAVIYALF